MGLTLFWKLDGGEQSCEQFQDWPNKRPRSREDAVKIPQTARLACCALLAGLVTVSPAAETERLRASLEFLASDALEGRGVGTAGIQKAASYLEEQFAEFGLGVRTQEFEVSLGVEVGENNSLVIVEPDGGHEEVQLEVGEQFTPLAIGGSGEVAGELVFVGYGISAGSAGFDEYDGLDVTGKVVLMIRKEPQQADEESVFNGTRPSQHAYFTTKVNNAQRHGAAAVILVNDRFGIEAQRKARQDRLERTSAQLAKLREGIADESAAEGAKDASEQQISRLERRLASLEKQLEGDADQLLAADGAGVESSQPTLPVFFAKREAVDRIVAASLGSDLATIEQQIDEDLKPRSQVLDGWRVRCSSHLVRKDAKVKNVIGVLEGRGPQAEQTVVVGAHYDHLGLGGRGSLAPWTQEIHNGADDNASGTAALLEIARRMAAGETPSRRVLFIAFAGEERGLLGSAHYVENPIVPLDATVAMVNMDMIGRLDNNKLTVYGTGTAKEFDALVDEQNETFGFELQKIKTGYGPSDHASFYRKQIPVFHFFTGQHSDYHRPSDDVENINLEGMGRVTDMITEIVQSIVEGETRPEFQEIRRRR